MNNRDEFSPEVKEKLAQRVGLLCSRCGCATSGPHENPTKAVNIGVAAHITAASPGGPRYDESLTKEQRSDISNGIWLCQFCAKLADNDVIRFPVERVRLWKHGAEQRRRQCVEEETLFPSDSFQPRFFELQQQLFDRITSSITFPSAALFEKNLAFFLMEE